MATQKEDWDEQLSRVRLMASDDPTWDLSSNDRLALQAMDHALQDAGMLIRRLCKALDGFPNRQQLREQALDWVKRKGLEGSILR